MYQYQIHLQEIMLGQILPFLQMPYFTSNCLCLGVSGWCLDGIWMVSDWCLDGPTVILDAANRVLMPKQVISVTVLSYAIFFQWPRRGLFLPKIQTSQNVNLARKECSNQKV